MKQIHILLTVLILALCSCKSSYYYRANALIEGEKIYPIDLDSTWELYFREGFLESSGKGLKELNVAPSKAASSGKRIEVEYLLISKDKQRVLYIATIPDKYRNRYEDDFMKDTINLYDARVFYYGRLTGDGKVIFYSKSNDKDRDIWTLRETRNDITIVEIREYKNDGLSNVISLGDALKDPLVFKKAKTYTIGHKDNSDEKPEFNEVKKGSLAVFIKEVKKGKYAIYFEMSKPINGFSHLNFLDQRVWYRPF